MTDFKIGEVVQIVGVRERPEFNGRDCEIIMPADSYPYRSATGSGRMYGYGVMIDGITSIAIVHPRCLRRIPRDHNEPSTWDESSAWKPEGLRT